VDQRTTWDSEYVAGDAAAWQAIGDVEKLFQKDKYLREQDVPVPDFFICGAAKSGTTSLFNYVGQHPAIYTPERKEPGYFSALRPLQSPYQYRKLFDDASKRHKAGEASGAYLTSPDSAPRISEVVPDAKIVIMLRNPAERAFSLYQWMVKEGYEWAPTFDRALQLEGARCGSVSFVRDNSEYYYNFLYRTSGCYAQQVKRFLKAFDREQVRFLVFDNFVSSPVPCTKEVFRFLEVDDKIELSTPVRNRGKGVRSSRLQFWLRQYGRPISMKIPSGLRFFEKSDEVE
jgi:hypothetical protein